eukprot:g8462.t1
MFHRKLQLIDAGTESSPRLPIDYFLRSLAEDQQKHAICIVLSGTGTDGTLGLKAIKAESGMAIVQEAQSARYAGMPSSAISTGLADYILPPAEMPARLVTYAGGPYLTVPERKIDEPHDFPSEPLQQMLLLLRSRTGHDFTSYKESTIRRRIERRLNVHQIEKPSDYVRYLQENPIELDILFKELLISVTNFFRDPEAWEALAEHLRTLIESRSETDTFRAWVPGCATGEEAFSLAILLRECIEQSERHLDIQIFGTDLDNDAIDVARTGQYPDGIAVDVDSKRLQRFFHRDDQGYRIRKEIREMVVFAPQNAIRDPPFTKLDFISCRNLLIYLKADLQKKLLPIFHYALKPKGLLFLGPSETIGAISEQFSTVDKRWKIFARVDNPQFPHALPSMPAQPAHNDGNVNEVARSRESKSQETHISRLIERLLLERFVPTSVVVNGRGEIAYIHGRTGTYLEPAPGVPRHNIVEMARDGLQIELAAALRQCNAHSQEVVQREIRVRSNGGFVLVDLTAARLTEPEALRDLILITLQPTPAAVTEARKKAKRKLQSHGSDERVASLERELHYLKESQQTTREELETSNEELKSSNEELQSTNEELQSTNEELETSKEELQSLNEELTTVNAELQSKVVDLSQANDDMQNLLNSTEIATVFLDNDLNIKRFTERAKRLFKLIQTDVGRPLGDLVSRLEYGDFVADCRSVLDTLIFKESEVRTDDEISYLMRIMPYRTSENVIDGLVMTFVNIDDLKQSRRAPEETACDPQDVIESMRHPVLVLDQKHQAVYSNSAYYRTFHSNEEQTIGKSVYELAGGAWDQPEIHDLLEIQLPKDTRFVDYAFEANFPEIGSRVQCLTESPEASQAGSGSELHQLLYELQVHEMELAIQNEDLRQSQLELAKTCDRFTDLYDFAPIGYLTLTESEKIVEANFKASQLLNVERQALIGSRLSEHIAKESQDEWFLNRRAAFRNSDTQTCELALCSEGESRMWVRVECSVAPPTAGSPLECRAILTDVSPRRQAEAEASHLRKKLGQIEQMSLMSEFATEVANELNQPLTVIAVYCATGSRILEKLKPQDLRQIAELFEKLQQEALRAGDIMRRVRSMVRRHTPICRPTSLPHVIQHALQLMECDLQHNGIIVEQGTREEIPSILADKTQIQQVLLNLLRNAIDATLDMPPRQRTISVSTTPSVEKMVQVTISDSGPGIAEENFDRVFDAFYSTKPCGAGMGLTICRTIIESHGGRIEVAKNSSGGSELRFWVPRAPDDFENQSGGLNDDYQKSIQMLIDRG